MKVEIDKGSGFCFGVVNAIQMAEEELQKSDKLYCLGDIVHNNVEVERLEKIGLITIDHEQYNQLSNCKVLIRAHGEPPSTYKIALQNNITLIDASCPVVLKLQNRIKLGFDEINKVNGQVVIYGKLGHAEVNGLVGQTNGKAVVVSYLADLEKVDFSRPVNLFSQTTQSLDGLASIIAEMKHRFVANGLPEKALIANDTVCRQVSHRDHALREFAKQFELILFVSGKKSSNGKVLYEVCLKENKNTRFVSDTDDLVNEWFSNISSVGICGATSTPSWLMQKIKLFIETSFV